MNAKAQVIELFRNENINPNVPKNISVEKNRHHMLLQSIGLHEQQKLIHAPKIGLIYEHLEGNDYEIWKLFLPKTYSKNAGEWKEYNFDTIPFEIIKEIEIVIEAKIFDDLEIWTPEEINIDPLLVGVLGTSRFLIARWGESLLSFEEIKETVFLKKCVPYNFSKLSNKIQEFIRNQFSDDPTIKILRAVKNEFSWHCWKPIFEIRISLQEEPSFYIDVCQKCGAYKKQ